MGLKADRTAICVIDAQTDECCAIFKSSTIQYKETFRFVHTLFYTYIPNSVIVVENNIDTLIEYFKNSTLKYALYYEPSKSIVREQRKNGFSQTSKNESLIYGITTTTENRPKYFDILFSMVHNEQKLICARELVEEIETLEYKTPTRIEAVSGTHDDVIFAYLIGVFVKRFGHNRARFGLFYSDGLEVKTNNVSPGVFRSSIADANQRSDVEEKYNNPFWRDMMSYDDDEKLEKKWRKQVSETAEDKLGYVADVFDTTNNVNGIKPIAPGAFFDLNDRNRGKGENVDTDDDAFAKAFSNFDSDDDSGSFF